MEEVNQIEAIDIEKKKNQKRKVLWPILDKEHTHIHLLIY